jgi:hypothetical protein
MKSRNKKSLLFFMAIAIVRALFAQNSEPIISTESTTVKGNNHVRIVGNSSLRKELTDKYSGELRGAVFEGIGGVELPIIKSRRGDQDTVTYYSFRYRPALAANGEYATLDFDGAVIGARRLERSSGIAEIVVLPSHLINRAKSGDWIRTGLYVPIDREQRIRASVDLVVRVDISSQEWDLFANRVMVANGISYRKGNGKISAKSASENMTSLSDLKVLDYNPLFVDDNFDGVPDDFAAKYNAHDRDQVIPGQGVSLVELYRKSR